MTPVTHFPISWIVAYADKWIHQIGRLSLWAVMVVKFARSIGWGPP